jgi:hypothetical protein
MLYHLRHQRRSRQRRLFACACCRRIWPLLTDERSRQAVEVAERFADGLASATDLDIAHREARKAASQANAAIMEVPVSQRTPPWKLWKGAEAVVHASAPRGTADAAEDAADASFVGLKQLAKEERAQCALVRDIFGNPYRPVTADPTWRTLAAVALARSIYDERRFEDLPVLGDALEEAFCTNADILAHCRGKGPHVRGCWVLDLILGKE